MSTDYQVVGKRLAGVDEKDKVLGNIVFADDFTMPGMLHAKVFRATKASARLTKLDVSKAQALPGVVCVLTAKDVPHNESVKNVVGQTTEVGLLEAKHQVLVRERVRYWGEPVALVAAETPKIAMAALKLIKAEYEDLPAVFDPLEALKPSAPKIHGNNNVIASWKLRKGDVAKGFAEADVIVENTYRTPRQEHAHIEPESGVAWVDDSGVVTVRYAAQVIEHYRDIATVLGLPESRVRIIGTLIGGGFGGKEDVTVEVFLALLAWKTNRPVKLTYTREEMGYGRHKRHPYVLKYKTGARKDGTLVALEAEVVSDAGAYVYLSPWVLIYSTVHATGPYLIPNVKVDARSVLTNNIMTSAFRGFGGMQMVVAYEAQMDELALRLGMDPLELRKKNFLKTGDVTASYQEITSQVRLEECARKALEALGQKSAASSSRKKVGRGFACCWQSYGRMTYLHDTSNCWVNLEMDGSAVVRTGIPDLGGGQRESVRAIVAEVLGLKVEEVHVISTDSQVTPLSGTVTATRALYMSGNAAKLAAESVRRIVAEKAAELLGVRQEVLVFRDKTVFSREDPGKKMALTEAIKQCLFQGKVPQSLEHLPGPVHRAHHLGRHQGPGVPRLHLRRPGGGGRGGHRDRRGAGAQVGHGLRRGQGRQPEPGRGADGRGRSPGHGLRAHGGLSGNGRAAAHLEPARLPDPHLQGHAGHQVHRDRVGVGQGTFRGQRHRRALDLGGRPGGGQRRPRRHRRAHHAPADHAGAGVLRPANPSPSRCSQNSRISGVSTADPLRNPRGGLDEQRRVLVQLRRDPGRWPSPPARSSPRGGLRC